MSKPLCPTCGSPHTFVLDNDGCDDEPTFHSCEECGTEFGEDCGDMEPSEDMDGDHESALASCGWGTDEDYGCYGGEDFNEPDMDCDY